MPALALITHVISWVYGTSRGSWKRGFLKKHQKITWSVKSLERMEQFDI